MPRRIGQDRKEREAQAIKNKRYTQGIVIFVLSLIFIGGGTLLLGPGGI